MAKRFLSSSDDAKAEDASNAIDDDGDILETIDVLVQDVGIIGLFSDWLMGI